MTFFLKKAIKDISDNRLLNGVAVITISLSVLIVSAFGLFLTNANEMIHSWKRGIRIMAYLSPAVSGEQASEMKDKIKTMYGVHEIRFISKTDALSQLRLQLKQQISLLDGLKENPLPNAFEIRLLPATRVKDRLEVLTANIEALDGISDVEYGQKWMDKISSILSLFRFAGFAMGGLFLMATVFIVANTIRLIIYSRREEVEIMRLVGATDRFIKLPFYIEGILQGLLGAILGLGVLYIAYLLITSNIGQGYFGAGFQFRFFTLGTSLAAMLLSMMIGWIGCFLSLNQFLKSS